jgi:hypothetical protein
VKIHGFANEDSEVKEVEPAELAEITLVAAPEELRRIAGFLEHCARGIETRGKSWEHEHLADHDRGFASSPHFVVFNPEYGQ